MAPQNLNDKELEEIQSLIHTTTLTISQSLDIRKKMWGHIEAQAMLIKDLQNQLAMESLE